ncbi:hypothetical protein AB0O58_24925, partial [Rhodococcus sp. NPDC080181]|uniref:hypothetical protein n=1 Tax=Rhodococcus sp. NPDC080181 TaxID=3155292 RepID=UPI00344EE57A
MSIIVSDNDDLLFLCDGTAGVLSVHNSCLQAGSGLLRFRFGFRCVVSDGGISGTAAGPPT